jgi:hypothetical protein
MGQCHIWMSWDNPLKVRPLWTALTPITIPLEKENRHHMLPKSVHTDFA